MAFLPFFSSLNYVFNREPLINTNKSGLKISKSSYLLRIIRKDTFEKNIAEISSPSVFFYFSNENNLYKFSNGQYFDIKHCNNLKEINKLLTA